MRCPAVRTTYRWARDARFGRRVELVAFDVEVVSARVGHGFREGRHDAASPAAERNPVVRGEAVGGIAQGVCLRCHMVEPGHRAVDELARCRVYSRIVATGSWICVVVVSSPELQAAKRSAASGNAYLFMFSIIFTVSAGIRPGYSPGLPAPGLLPPPSPGVFSAPEGGRPQLHRSPGVRSAAGWHGAASGCRFACLSRTGQKYSFFGIWQPGYGQKAGVSKKRLTL